MATRALLLVLVLLTALSGRSALARLTPDAPVDAAGEAAERSLMTIEDASVAGLFADLSLIELVAIARGGGEEQDRPPWSHFRRAHEAIEAGDRNAAIAALRAVLDDPETREGVALWTWANLRRLGVEPPEDLAEAVQGVVFELPVAGGTEYLSAYADGRWRYVHALGGGTFWERADDPDTTKITAAILTAGQRLMPWAPQVPERASRRPGAIRVTLLTFGGLHQVTLAEPLFTPAAPTRPVLTALIDGMVRLMKHITDITGEED